MKSTLVYSQRIYCHLKVIFEILNTKIILMFYPLDKLISYLKNQKKSGKNKRQYVKSEYLFYLHKKYIELFKIKKCLSKASSLSSVFYSFGFEAKFHVGINANHKFSSHAWVELNEKAYFSDEKKDYSKLLSI
tara:strand:+ start:681 stop:1079 length:399 start_codon:yes stop_codon:yes gene_type:complete